MGNIFYADADDLSVASERISGGDDENLTDRKPRAKEEKFTEVELRFVTEDEKRSREENIHNTTKANTSILAKLKYSICFCY